MTKPIATHFPESFRVGRYTATLSVVLDDAGLPAGIDVAWEPEYPPTLTPDEVQQYTRFRDAAIDRFAALTGHRILVVDL